MRCLYFVGGVVKDFKILLVCNSLLNYIKGVAFNATISLTALKILIENLMTFIFSCVFQTICYVVSHSKTIQLMVRI